MKTEQFNTRIPAQLKRAIAAVSGALNWSQQEVAEAALAANGYKP